MPSIVFAVGAVCNGFVVRNVTPLPESAMVAYEFEHIPSGARLIHLHTEDNENLFSISFPTLPPDDTGVPHILEHTVLAGSKRFPVRDPFFEMYKMSMATFINAMTGQDCTYYPVASNVQADLMNLADVYFDAVFHPLLSKETFLREGWHYAPKDPANPTGELTINGIVYNEMKAYASRPETRLWRMTQKGLFPDTGYGRDSGGDPKKIPELSYEQFRAFYETHYRYDTARFVTYGNLEPSVWTAFLEKRLSVSTPKAQTRTNVDIKRPQPFVAPVAVQDTYDIGDEEAEAKTFLQLAWRVPGGENIPEQLLLQVLALILGGDDAAPLKRAIVDSKLGTDFLGCDMAPQGKDGIFAVGLRGSEECHAEAFKKVVMDTLSGLCENGIPAELIESAFRRTAYSVREISDQRPLAVAGAVIGAWTLDEDPLTFLRMGTLLDQAKASWQQRPTLFQDLIKKYLLENVQRIDVVLAPDPEWQIRTDKEFAEQMKAVRATLSDDAMRQLAEEDAAMQVVAGTPNSPEALATLPQLQRSQLPDTPTEIPMTTTLLPSGIPFVRTGVFANGVNYMALFVSLEGLPRDLWEAVPFYLDAVNKMGAGQDDYAAMARRVSATTGGLYARTTFMPHATQSKRTVQGVTLSMKMLSDQPREALAVVKDKLLSPAFDDHDRWHTVLTQTLAEMQSDLIDSGPRTAQTELMMGVTETGYLGGLTDGLHQYRLVSAILDAWEGQNPERRTQNVELDASGGKDEGKNPERRIQNVELDASGGNDLFALLEKVRQIHAFTLNAKRWTVAFTGDDDVAEIVKAWAEETFGTLPSSPIERQPTGFVPFAVPPRTGYAAPMQVAHCVQVLPAPEAIEPTTILLQLGMTLLRVDYMISELRFKGNAYGANCAYGSGAIVLTTFADPHIKRTLDTFANITNYVAAVPWDDAEVTRGVLSTAKAFVRPLRPESATESALAYALTGRDFAATCERYRILRHATGDDVRTLLAPVLERGFATSPV
ncbi:MAG: insulinase family protein, partial [Kiritimatiellaeota bacterium]|nr:insulinase family protein [Kiritimatiellota bacterium]